MNENKVNVSVELSDVTNKCLRQIRNTTLNVEYTFNAILNIDTDRFPPLQVDGLPIRIYDPESLNDKTTPREKALDWLLRKAFEDFIVGLTESLIEAYKTVKFFSFANKTKIHSFTIEKIEEEIEKINKKPLSLSFPNLIDEIESELNSPFSLCEEIKSINQVRNCLVHDNGIVSNRRINDKENNLLRLKFIELIVIAEKNGEIIQVKLQDKIDKFETNGMEVQMKPNSIAFKKGEHIKITQNLFNHVSFTCIRFVEELFNAMPKQQ